MLRHLKRVAIAFPPGDAKSASARELLQRLGCDNARKSNPACVLDFTADEAAAPGSAAVELVFADGECRRIATADLRIQDVVRVIEEKAVEMELRDVLAEVKYDPAAAENRLTAAALRPLEARAAAAAAGKR